MSAPPVEKRRDRGAEDIPLLAIKVHDALALNG